MRLILFHFFFSFTFFPPKSSVAEVQLHDQAVQPDAAARCVSNGRFVCHRRSYRTRVRVISDACTRTPLSSCRKRTRNIPLTGCCVRERTKGRKERRRGRHMGPLPRPNRHLLHFTYQSFDTCPSGLSQTCTVCHALPCLVWALGLLPLRLQAPLSKACAFCAFYPTAQHEVDFRRPVVIRPGFRLLLKTRTPVPGLWVVTSRSTRTSWHFHTSTTMRLCVTSSRQLTLDVRGFALLLRRDPRMPLAHSKGD